jgi:hypothetical protein
MRPLGHDQGAELVPRVAAHERASSTPQQHAPAGSPQRSGRCAARGPRPSPPRPRPFPPRPTSQLVLTEIVPEWATTASRPVGHRGGSSSASGASCPPPDEARLPPPAWPPDAGSRPHVPAARPASSRCAVVGGVSACAPVERWGSLGIAGDRWGALAGAVLLVWRSLRALASRVSPSCARSSSAAIRSRWRACSALRRAISSSGVMLPCYASSASLPEQSPHVVPQLQNQAAGLMDDLLSGNA